MFYTVITIDTFPVVDRVVPSLQNTTNSADQKHYVYLFFTDNYVERVYLMLEED